MALLLRHEKLLLDDPLEDCATNHLCLVSFLPSQQLALSQALVLVIVAQHSVTTERVNALYLKPPPSFT